jgi:hypothetical protein
MSMAWLIKSETASGTPSRPPLRMVLRTRKARGVTKSKRGHILTFDIVVDGSNLADFTYDARGLRADNAYTAVGGIVTQTDLNGNMVASSLKTENCHLQLRCAKSLGAGRAKRDGDRVGVRRV